MDTGRQPHGERSDILIAAQIAEGNIFLTELALFLGGGLVTTILGPIVSVQDFIAHNASGIAVITTRKVPEYIRALEEWDISRIL